MIHSASTPRAHRAVVTLTGWPRPRPTGIEIAGVFVRTAWRPGETPERVTVRAFPHTTPTGELRDLFVFPRAVRPAGRTPNGAQVQVTGQLLKLDRGEQLIRVKVCPAVADTLPFVVTLHAGPAVLSLNPEVFHVDVTGHLLQLGRGLLLADTVVPVFAPVPARWHRWRPRRKRPSPVLAAQDASDSAGASGLPDRRFA